MPDNTQLSAPVHVGKGTPHYVFEISIVPIQCGAVMLRLYVLPPPPIEIAHQPVIRNLEYVFATEPDIRQVAGSWTALLASDDQARAEPLNQSWSRCALEHHHWENTCTSPD